MGPGSRYSSGEMPVEIEQGSCSHSGSCVHRRELVGWQAADNLFEFVAHVVEKYTIPPCEAAQVDTPIKPPHHRHADTNPTRHTGGHRWPSKAQNVALNDRRHDPAFRSHL